ncbi:MAG: WecB/TagA/CpsF family glycosyltransferase [Candidatus Omnitrophica bacterium]|nr:WecB/TagA/CpsF family glycosyltransferase [Candidatus Omnitrophota bacterium]
MMVLGTKVSITNLDHANAYIEDCVKKREKTYICIAPVSTIVDAHADERYREIVNHSGLTTPDGMPLVWLGKWRGKRTISRTYGPDLMFKFFAISQTKGYKHYFYGGSQETNRLLVSRLREQFPGVNIVGDFPPSIMKVCQVESESVLRAINDAKPDVLWIGLGSPKQDYWMSNHRPLLDVPVMIGVGAAFDFIAGTKKQAPRWMHHAGLEWFFRLCCEPRRLWKRYLFGNTKFICLLLMNSFRKE